MIMLQCKLRSKTDGLTKPWENGRKKISALCFRSVNTVKDWCFQPQDIEDGQDCVHILFRLPTPTCFLAATHPRGTLQDLGTLYCVMAYEHSIYSCLPPSPYLTFPPHRCSSPTVQSQEA